MTKVRTLMLRAPGTNCDTETVFAFEQAGSEVNTVHINELIYKDQRLTDYRIMVIPGGFTYGDDIAAGKVLANELKVKLGEDVRHFIDDGGLILGICNGFQVLVKAGFLPNLQGTESQELSLAPNDSGRFECRWVYLVVNTESPCIFTKGIEIMYLSVAHGEGKLVCPADLLPHLNIVVRYADEKGNTEVGYPWNPNNSVNNIAGICDQSGRIFALMPHPERHIRRTQHPRWTSLPDVDRGNCFPIFRNAVRWVEEL